MKQHLYLADQVRELDRAAIEGKGISGITLMKRAAEACLTVLRKKWPDPERVAVLCGSGNNAGDGFILAGLLAARGVPVTVSLVGREPSAETDAGMAWEFCQQSGVSLVAAAEAVPEADLVVDALLGTGISGKVRPNYAEVIALVNQGGSAVLAIDVPSGLCSDTGLCLGACIKADVTVTFIGKKAGLFMADGQEMSGQVEFADLDVPPDVYAGVDAAMQMLDFEALVSRLEPRHRNAHKMSHGHVLIVGGDEGMGGAVLLAAEAASMTGCGLVSVATHPNNVSAILARRPEVMPKAIAGTSDLLPLLERADVLVLGPGLGVNDFGQQLFKAVLDAAKPLVVDADGLNLLARKPVQRTDWILTPHPGEASRLLGQDAQADRLQSVRALRDRFGGIALLKGAGTLMDAGTGQVALCPYGNPGMAVAGMGDVLSGVIGSLLAQGGDAALATMLGVAVHSLAADNIVKSQGERGLLAGELAPEMRRLLNMDVAS